MGLSGLTAIGLVVGVFIGATINALWRKFFWSSDAKWSKKQFSKPLTWLDHINWAIAAWTASFYLSLEPLAWIGITLMIDEYMQDHPMALGSGHEFQTWTIATVEIIALFLVIRVA